METGRSPEHARNLKLELLLRELNSLLADGEAKVVERFERPSYPVVFIVGCARGGTTLAMQYLAATGLFSYPSNLIARFYNAPYIGARIQQMLTETDCDFRDELTAGRSCVSSDFSSCLGKTKGLLSPSEFWYFWRRFFPQQEIQAYDDDALRALDTRVFTAELAALESVRGLPIVMKGLFLNWNIKFLSRLFDKAVFLHLRRHPFYNMQSLLRARSSFFGREDAWYSFKPPEYDDLRHRSVEEQLAGQVFHTNRAITEGMDELPSERRLVVDYESLCSHPMKVIEALAEKLALQGYTIRVSGSALPTSRAKCTLDLPAQRVQRLIDAYRALSGQALAPL